MFYNLFSGEDLFVCLIVFFRNRFEIVLDAGYWKNRVNCVFFRLVCRKFVVIGDVLYVVVVGFFLGSVEGSYSCRSFLVK